jgi:hypothetical protein
MDRIGRPQKLKGPTPTDCLMQVPILRGWDGNHEAEDWMTVGSGRKLESIGRLRDEMMSLGAEEEWQAWSEHLSPEFVHYARTNRFIRFLCPHCRRHI